MIAEISFQEKRISLRTLNQLNAKKIPIIWKPSDEDIRTRQPSVECSARLTLNNKLHGFLLGGRFYHPNGARVWAMRNQLSINYLLKLTEVILERSSL